MKEILSAGVLAKFVIGDEGGPMRVLSLLKVRGDDGIVYSPGLTSHKIIAAHANLPHSSIGFAGRVQGWMETDARLSRGGMSLTTEYRPEQSEMDRTFELIEAMMAQLGGKLTWDNSI